MNFERLMSIKEHSVKKGKWSNHIVSGDERVIDSDKFNVITLQCHPSHQSTNSSKTYIHKNQKIIKKKNKCDKLMEALNIQLITSNKKYH